MPWAATAWTTPCRLALRVGPLGAMLRAEPGRSGPAVERGRARGAGARRARTAGVWQGSATWIVTARERLRNGAERGFAAFRLRGTLLDRRIVLISFKGADRPDPSAASGDWTILDVQDRTRRARRADDGDLAEREAAYEKFVWDNLRRNYLGNYLHGMLGMTGFRLVNAPTFLPAYLHMISGSNTIVGPGPGAAAGGRGDLADLRRHQIEHRTKVMPAAMWMGGLARMAVLGIAIAGWLLKGQPLVERDARASC